MKTKIISLFVLVALLVTTGIGCKGGSSEAQEAALTNVSLEYWRVFDDDDVLRETIDAYRAIHPNVSIKVKKMRFEEYEDELVQAFAEGRGPDMFSVHSSWLTKYQPLITPMPETVELVYNELKGGIKQEIVAIIKEESTISNREVKDTYIDTVYENVVREYQPDSKTDPEDRVWGLPYSVDTLALFYNKDMLNAAGVAEPPSNWEAFQDAVQAMTILNLDGDVVQSGAAIGTTENVERAFDIVSLLMMQNGTPMTSDSGRATFAEVPEGSSSRVPPALSAIEFYSDFANPIKVVYSWNDNQLNSFDAFANGTAGFFLGYAYHIPLIRAQSPKLDFAISPVPQISESKTVNYANYWLETVSKSNENSDYAWDFIQFAASAEQVGDYLESANKPTALRSLINTQLDDLDLGVFASQILTAEDWYKGDDYSVAEQAVLDFVDTYLAGTEDPNRDLAIAQSKVNQTL